ncbi:MAG: hypothetical protein JSV16_12110 [Candidatus Hydrogenedentota bacterium]|nr:MAG: hypothetical protein JSV16_12110 [Candidatus Hydrogenedentota bacterium]
MRPSLRPIGTETQFAEPETTITCFFNSIFGHVRNWPRAYSCLGPDARGTFDSMHGLPSFADYWEDKLSFLEELVKKRHMEFPYRHRSCFSLDNISREESSADRALIEVELVENHIARERLVILQTKELTKQGQNWLLTNGELEGNLDSVIVVRSLRPRRPYTDSVSRAVAKRASNR